MKNVKAVYTVNGVDAILIGVEVYGTVHYTRDHKAVFTLSAEIII